MSPNPADRVQKQPPRVGWAAIVSRVSPDSIDASSFEQQSPLRELHTLSRRDGPHHHIEGPAAIEHIRHFVAELREAGVPRISESALARRIDHALGFAEAVFNATGAQSGLSKGQQVEAVVFYGSALRGKPDSGDFDFRVVTSHDPPEIVDLHHPVMTPLEQKVSKILEADTAVPKKLDGLPVEVFINSTFDEPTGMSLIYATRCPYLVIVRGADVGSGIYGPSKVFVNTASTTYTSERSV